MKPRAFRTALLCAAVLAGCTREDRGEEEASRKTRQMTTAEVMDQVARATYQPPADGQLTEEQVQQYLEVRRHARSLPGGEPGVAADLRAALELGFNPKEVGWVEERVQEAWIALRGRELDEKIAESRNQMIRDLEAQLESATDPGQRRELEKQIAEIRAAAPLATEAPPAVGHNVALIRGHESEVAEALADARVSREARDGR